MEFYNGNKLLNLKDVHGKKPEIFICSGNRTSGKTVFFSSFIVKRFLKYGEQFIIVFRYESEIDHTEDQFFPDIQRIFFPNLEMTSKKRFKGRIEELFINGNTCGYAVALSSYSKIKRFSHIFTKVSWMYTDEFQSEDSKYLSNEVEAWQSLHMTVARGQGQMVRWVGAILLSNYASLLNPYYLEMDIANKLKADTKYLRGDGFVMEANFNNDAAEAQASSAFNRALKKSRYTRYATEKVYLNDNSAFIGKVSGNKQYIATIKYKDNQFALWQLEDSNYFYVDYSVDYTWKIKFVTSANDMIETFQMYGRSDRLMEYMRNAFHKGNFRFKDLLCKEAVLYTLAYR